MSPPPRFKDRVVRDLWWAVTSPGLMPTDFCPLVPQFDSAPLLSSFAELDADPAPLHRAVARSLARERLRLGAYFEDLIQFFLQDVARHREVKSGVVIQDGKRTVGELDLLFRTGEACHHWELAVKFYLHVADLATDPGDCFVGPQTRDRLHVKTARVRDHQLPLATQMAAAEPLAPWQPLSSAALLRGRLFYAASTDWRAGVRGAPVASDHLRGWWCRAGQLEELLPHADSYALLSRREWFSPVDATHDPVTPLTRNQAVAWAREAAAKWPAGETRTQVVAGLDSTGQEMHRGFLVSKDWPREVT